MANAVLRTLARQVISLLPGKVRIIERGATLPPSFRNVTTIRFLSAVAAQCASLPPDLDTNLGIDKRLRVRIPSSKPSLLFGRPRLFVGERSSLELARALFQLCDCFLDVGSNVGLYIFYLRHRNLSSKPIYFFEPDPTLFSQLEQNISRNRIHNVKGFQVAMADRVGRAIFYRNKTDDNSGSLVREDWSSHVLEAIDVNQTSFGAFVSENQLKNICAKVDIEGAEELFVDGAKPHLSDLNYLIIEILGPAIKRGFPQKMIREGNFQAYYINDYDLEHSASGEFTYVDPFYNWLFCKDSPTSLRNKLKGTRFQVMA